MASIGFFHKETFDRIDYLAPAAITDGDIDLQLALATFGQRGQLCRKRLWQNIERANCLDTPSLSSCKIIDNLTNYLEESSDLFRAPFEVIG